MQIQIIYGILIPFIGTAAGAACVFFLRRQPHFLVQRGLTGFAAGVMTAASVWSLLIPAMEQSASLGRLGFVPAAAAVLTVLLSGLVVPSLPYLLSFAAGAMLYVVVEELIPEMSGEPHSNIGTLAFAAGFVVMMSLDTALG